MKTKEPNILVEKMSTERAEALYDAILESLQALRAQEFIDESEVTLEEVAQWQAQTDEFWKNDQEYPLHHKLQQSLPL